MGAEIPESEVEAAYWAGQSAATNAARGRNLELSESIGDAATDAVMWAIENYDPTKAGAGGFASFAASSVRKFIRRTIYANSQKAKHYVGSIDAEGAVEPEAGAVTPDKPILIDDLPPEIEKAVRFVFLDGFTLREAALLCGVGHVTVLRHIRKAAQLLAPGRLVPIRPAGERRLGRVQFGSGK
jgi:predicted DNA-binding protein (UPF0251 family)